MRRAQAAVGVRSAFARRPAFLMLTGPVCTTLATMKSRLSKRWLLKTDQAKHFSRSQAKHFSSRKSTVKTSRKAASSRRRVCTCLRRDCSLGRLSGPLAPQQPY